MNPLIAAAIAATINGAFEIWRIHANKPEGWKPTVEDWNALLAEIDAASPESEKAAARKRLNLPVDVVEKDSPQAPV